MAISGCVYAAPRLEKQAKLELYATGALLLCKNNGSYGDFCFYSFPFHSRTSAFTLIDRALLSDGIDPDINGICLLLIYGQ